MSRKTLLSLMAAAFLCSALLPRARICPKARQGNCGGQMQQLPCAGGARRQRIHGRGLASALRMILTTGAAFKEEVAPHAVSGEDYPEKNKAAAVAVPGPSSFDEDLAAATPLAAARSAGRADGTLWYTGQMANVLAASIRKPARSRNIRSRPPLRPARTRGG